MLEEDFGCVIEMKIGIKNRRSDKRKQCWPFSLQADLYRIEFIHRKMKMGCL